MLGVSCLNGTADINILNGWQCSGDYQNLFKKVYLQLETSQKRKRENSYFLLKKNLVFADSSDCYRLPKQQPTTQLNWNYRRVLSREVYNHYCSVFSYSRIKEKQTEQSWFCLQLHIHQKLVRNMHDMILKIYQSNRSEIRILIQNSKKKSKCCWYNLFWFFFQIFCTT